MGKEGKWVHVGTARKKGLSYCSLARRAHHSSLSPSPPVSPPHPSEHKKEARACTNTIFRVFFYKISFNIIQCRYCTTSFSSANLAIFGPIIP